MNKQISKWYISCMAVIMMVMILSLAACGNSGTKTASSPAAPGSTAAPANAIVAPSSSSETPKATGALDLATFEKGRDEALKSTPMQFSGPTEKATAPKGLKIALISCSSSLHGCVSPMDGADQAAKELGWTVQKYDGGGSPDQQNKMMLNAISWGAKVIINIAIDPNLVQQGLKAAQDAGVMVVSGSNGIDTPNPTVKLENGKLGYAFDVAPNYAGLGTLIADWIIADSKGKANIVVFSDKEFPSVLAVEVGLLAELKKCTTCTVNELQYFTGNQIGTSLPTQTIGFLRNHPEVNYLFSPFDPAAADQVAAIKQANMGDKVKVISVLGNQQNIEFIRKGEVQVADAAYDNEYMGWAIIDQVIRLFNKQKLFDPHGENLPYGVIDSTNIPKQGKDWLAPFDYKSKFKELWS
jgi:ribose transport system substrate-binding protein